MHKLGLVIPWLLVACPGPYEEACSADQLARLERAYQAELVQYCAGQNDCSERPRIDAKYRRLREDWVRCDRENQ
jgi:hypothetical protein